MALSRQPFHVWMKQVDRVISQKVGLSSGDLADQTWRDWYEDGMSPADAADLALEEEGYDELSGDL